MGFAWFALAMIVGLPAACQVGYWLGRRRRASQDETTKSHVMNWQAAVLAMAALLIGFTFSMAVDRWEARKQVLVAEANAIGTTYLRTRVLTTGWASRCASSCGATWTAVSRSTKPALIRPAVEQHEQAAAALQAQIWSRLTAAAHADPRSVMTGLLMQSTNAMFDVAGQRRALREARVPWTVFAVLVLVSGIALASVGHSCGVARKMMPFGMFVMPLLVAAVIVLVFDIAHPRVGIVRVSDQGMLRLKQAL